MKFKQGQTCMKLHVAFPAATLTKFPITLIALVRLFFGMTSHVILKLSFHYKFHVTHLN